MRVIKYGKVYITRGGHLYRVVALTREAVTFESRGGWKETWPIDRFMAAVEPEPVEPQPAPFRRFTVEAAFMAGMRYRLEAEGASSAALCLVDRVIAILRDLDAPIPPPEPDGLESALQKLGARATGAVPGERRLDPETFQEVKEAVDRALTERRLEPKEKP